MSIATSHERPVVPRRPPANRVRLAMLAICVGDVGLLLWGAAAAVAPGCPGACMTKGYQAYTGQSWSDLRDMSAPVADFVSLVFRVYGAYIVAFSVVALAITVTAFRAGERWAWWTLLIGNTIAYPSAMAYDLSVGFIGPFEALEYVGLALIYVSLAITAPFSGGKRAARAVG